MEDTLKDSWEPKASTSQEIRKRVEEAGARAWANDNISEFIEEGEKQKLIDEAIPAFENVLQSLVIDTKTDPNSMDTARRMAKMYINEIMSGRYDEMPNPSAFPNYIEGGYEGMFFVFTSSPNGQGRGIHWYHRRT